VGSGILQMARLFGASEIVAVDVRPEKLEAARALGATRTVDARSGDPADAVLAATGGRGVDVAFEALGRPETVVQAFRMTRDGGRTVVAGVAEAGAAAPIEINRLVRRGIRLAGTFGCRVRTDMPELIRLAARGQVDVRSAVTRRYRLEETADAYAAMDRGEILGRAIVVLRPGT
jgi:S-(hydroxymethyl)glutathione dehydrogenase/alcohol dehydrogenase